MNGYENLANAIILQAVKDYKRALRTLKYNPRHYESMKIKREVEQFFRSAWFADLTEADGEMILEAIKLKYARKKEAV